MVVWPERDADFIGSLYDLDEGDRTINALGQSQFTVRASEKATETGYAFLEPVHEYECVTLDDDNYGNFVTGYRQLVFTAKDDELKCSETVDLVHSEHSSTPGVVETIQIFVEKKACPAATCPEG